MKWKLIRKTVQKRVIRDRSSETRVEKAKCWTILERYGFSARENRAEKK